MAERLISADSHVNPPPDLWLHDVPRPLADRVPRVESTPEGDGSLLDNCMIVYGAALADGNRHSHEDLSTIMVGRGGSNFKSGRRIVSRKETPMCNLFLTMMDRMGVHVEHFGDSTGRLDGLNLG